MGDGWQVGVVGLDGRADIAPQATRMPAVSAMNIVVKSRIGCLGSIVLLLCQFRILYYGMLLPGSRLRIMEPAICSYGLMSITHTSVLALPGWIVGVT